jgi:hypothetical protein
LAITGDCDCSAVDREGDTHRDRGVLIGAGAITTGFSYLFGTKNTAAQVLMTAGLAMTIALVLFSILALEQPFAGITG